MVTIKTDIKQIPAKKTRRLLDREKILTPRISRLKDAYLAIPIPQLCAERSHFLTGYFKSSEGEPVLLRRANAFRHILENITITIRDDELIVGSQTKYVRGASAFPEFRSEWLKEDLMNDSLSQREARAQSCSVSEEDKKVLLHDVEYWLGKSLQDHMRTLTDEKWHGLLEQADEARLVRPPNDLPLARRGLDYEKVLKRGFRGIIEDARKNLKDLEIVTNEDLQKNYFWKSVIISSEAAIQFAKRHAALARLKAIETKDIQRKKELEKIAEICEYVPENSARTFPEALQSFWFVHLLAHIENCANGYSPGRFGQYMYPYYQSDTARGRLTREEAAELLACLWVKFTEVEYLRPLTFAQGTMSMYQNIAVGGLTPEGKDATNELEFLILDVTEDVKLIQPAVTIIYDEAVSGDLLMRALEVVRTGGGMPAWFNNKYAIATLEHFGVPLEEARTWSPHGCVEVALPGSSMLANNMGTINLAKCLELALNNGLDPRTKKQVGPKTGDPSKFKEYQDLYKAFEKQLIKANDLIANYSNTVFALHQDLAPIPFNSTVTRDCVEKGKDITAGGARYYDFIGFLHFGMVSTGNSLAAIKKLVFEDRKISIGDLLKALEANFEGFETVQKQLTEAPKYGNDDDYVDLIVADLWRLCKDRGSHYKTAFGNPVSAVFHSATNHYALGNWTGALPDGRRAYTPLADGSMSPFPQTDKKGPTAIINSAVKMKPFPALSTLFNMKFHPQLLKTEENLKKLLALIKTYYDQMGYHIQFNVVNLETLLDARKHPKKYRGLVIRVAGFSMFWVDLPSAVQDEIIARTWQEL